MMLLMLTGCQYNYYPRFTFETIEGKEGRDHLQKAEEKAGQKKFQEAMAENRKGYELFHPGLKQEAIFQKALLYFHPDNPERDYEKSMLCFDLVDKSHDNMALTCNATLVRAIVQKAYEMEKKADSSDKELIQIRETVKKQEKTVAALLEEQNALKAYIEKLMTQLNQLKEIDLNSLTEKREVTDE